MTVATPIEVRQIGLALESVRGTPPAAPTKFLSLTKDSEIEYTTKLLEDPALRGVNARYPSFAGIQVGKGPLKTPVRAQNISEFLTMLLGTVTSTEQASFVVTTGVNDTIDFNIGAGNLVATVAGGTYIAGQSASDNPSLCKAVYDAIHAAEGAGTYTVTYSRSTGFFTITRSAGTFQMKFLTGPNTAKTIAALIGFAVVDQTGALTYSSTVQQKPPFKHAMTQGQVTQLPSYAFYMSRGLAANPIKKYNLGSMERLKFHSTNESPVEMEATIMAQQEAIYGGAWSPTYTESPALMFSGTTVKIAGSAPSVPNIKSWSFEAMPGLKEYRPLSQTQYPSDFLAAGPFSAQGDMVVYFMDEVERAKFIAASTTSIEIIAAGGVVAGGTPVYTFEALFPAVEYDAFPFGDEDGFLGAKVKWKARYDTTTSKLMSAYVINSVIPGF